MNFLVLLALVVVAASRPENHYDNKYDNFNVDELTSNKRLMCAYGHCFMGDGKCTPEGNDIRGWMDEGIKTTCAKCTDKQKTLVAKFIKSLREICPEEWEVLSIRGDPEGKRTDDLNKFLEEHAH